MSEVRERVKKDVKSMRSGKRERISITLTKQLIARLDEESGKYGLSRSAFVEWQLREKLNMIGFQY